MSEPNEVAAPVILRQFPASVIAPNGTIYEPTRAILTRDGLYVYGVVNRKVATVVAVEPQTGIRHDGIATWIKDGDGNEWQILKGPGCGCGSPLKRMSRTPPKFLNVEPDAVRV